MNYWQLLANAREDLGAGRFRAAEAGLAAARATRAADRRGRLLTETLPDGARRLWQRVRRQPPDADAPGRWHRAEQALVRAFATAADTELARAERRLAAGPAEDPAEARTLLANALYLSVASDLVTRRLPVAPLVEALFDLLPFTGALCDRDLVRPDLPAATRQRLAAQACDHLGRLPAAERTAWCDHLLVLLDAGDGRPDAAADPAAAAAPAGDDPAALERAWLAARLADAHAAAAQTVLARWAACDRPEAPAERRQWSRLRRLEILTDGDRRRVPVPRPAEARELAASLPRAGDDQVAARTRHAVAILEHRLPAADPDAGWLSGAITGDDTVHLVLWWAEEPRAVATWHPDHPLDDVVALVASAAGRLLWAGEAVPAAVRARWPEAAWGRPLRPLAEAILEPWLPRAGWDPALVQRLALARTGAWRDGWRDDLGDPRLQPPGRDGRLGPDQAPLEPALHAGLLWLAVRHRLNTADPALRAGLGELGRRGAAAAAFLHTAAILGVPEHATVDATFAPWTLPLLWTRPDPLPDRGGEEDPPGREDLSGQDVAVVVTGHPGRALAAWGPGERRWRVVCDHPGRLADLRRQAREAYGPVTVVPPGGEVHVLAAALRRLEDLAGQDDLLAVCHWVRLVESHNGDLLDLQTLRPRAAGACPLYERWAASIADLPREPVGGGDDPADPRSGGWAAQYAQRAHRSGLLAGLAGDLPADAARLDAVWGVFDGSEAAWVFHDSAAVHWRLAGEDPQAPARCHALLAPRGRRHLSLLAGRGWCPDDLASWFDRVLAPYGRPYHGDLGDARPPRLRLVGAGPLPGADLLPAPAAAAQLAHLAATAERTTVLIPRAAGAAALWRAAADGRFGPASWQLVDGADQAGARLVVPELTGMAALAAVPPAPPTAAGTDPVAAWAEADRDRAAARAQARRQVALECAALLASAAAVVEILDARWWRWLARAGEPAAAAAELGLPAADTIDLPAEWSGPEARAVAAWNAERGLVPGQLPGWPGPPLTAASPPADTGVRYVLAPGAELWRDLVADLVGRWQRGQPVTPLLVVAQTPPPGAAAAVAALRAPGASVLTGGEPEPAGPLLWARPEELHALLARGWQPAAGPRVVVLGAERLLPDAAGGQERPEGARLLAWLRATRPARLDLVGAPLPAPWLRHLAGWLGAEVPPPPPEPGGWSALRRGPAPAVARPCPGCGETGAGGLDGRVCPACGTLLTLAPLLPTAAAEERAAEERAAGEPAADVAARARVLLAEADRGREEPLEIWGPPVAIGGLADAATAAGGAVAPAAAGMDATLPDGRRWALRPLAGGAAAGGDAVLLWPPADPARLQPRAPVPRSAELTLLYDHHDLARAAAGPAAGVARLLRLLADPHWRDGLAAAAAGAPRAAIPVWRLAWQAGLAPAAVRRTLARLRWLASLHGDRELARPRPSAGAAGGGARLRVLLPPRQQELTLASLVAQLEGIVTALLAGGLPGALHEAAAPAAPRAAGGGPDPAPDALADPSDAPPAGWLDGVLGRLATGGGPLVYRADGGAWFEGRRQVGWLGPREAVTGALVARLDAVMAWSRDVLDGTSRVDPGDEVALPPAPAAAARDALALGEELGFWSLDGAGGSGHVALAELRRLGESADLADGTAAAALVTELATAADRWVARLAATPAGGAVVPAPAPADGTTEPPAAGSSRPGWWRRRRDPLIPLRDAVATVATDGGPGRLVIAGPPGSGRLEAVLGGLSRQPAGRRATIWAPDAATAAAAHLQARARDATWSPDLHVRDPDATPAPARRAPAAAHGVHVVLEVQGYPPEVAYQLQDAAREGALVVTVDSAVVGPSVPENLLLTTPRQAEVRHLRVSRRAAQAPWQAAASLLPAEVAESRPARRDRGHVQTRRAGSLDECAAAVAAARSEDRLGPLVTVVVPLAEDVALLQRALSDRGWAAVRQEDLLPHLLPGGLEMACALADVHRQEHGRWPGDTDGALDGAVPWLLPGLLPAAERGDWRAWLRLLPPAVRQRADTTLTWLRRSPWGLRCAGRSAARRHAARLARGAAAGPPEAVLSTPLWCAWRAEVAGALGTDTGPLAGRELAPPAPVAVLTTADAPGAGPAESLVYVCFGSEPPAVHRPVLLRASDRLLVLYQEHSPLPADRDAGPGD